MFVGTDIENISRLDYLLARKPQLVKKIFFESEWNYALTKANPAATLTGIWCAKEAVLKAFTPVLKLSLTQIEILKNPIGAHPEAFIRDSEAMGFEFSLSVSISHTRDLATATALLYVKD